MSESSGFEDFVRSYQDMVYATALRLLKDPALSEDAAQETFLRAWERFDEVRGYEAPGGWLKTVATNLCLNHLSRHAARWAPVEEAERLSGGPSASAGLEARDEAERLERALEALPERQRVPLVLFHWHEMSYEEIAARLGVSAAKLKTDIFRGREALRRALGEDA